MKFYPTTIRSGVSEIFTDRQKEPRAVYSDAVVIEGFTYINDKKRKFEFKLTDEEQKTFFSFINRAWEREEIQLIKDLVSSAGGIA